MKKISVVIPVYNAEKYLVNTIENLTSQTYQNTEFIFVDDGSTDNSYNIITEFSEKDNRIIIVKKINEGPGIARNAGMRIASGEYIIFLDADDNFDRNMLQLMAEALDKTGADMTICKARVYDKLYKNEKVHQAAINEDILEGIDVFRTADYYNELFQLTAGFVWNKMFRLEFLRKNHIEFFMTYTYEDLVVTSKSLIAAEKIALIHKELMTYRANNENSITTGMDDRWTEQIEVFEEIYRYIIGKKLYSELEKTFLNRVALVLYASFTKYVKEEAISNLYNYYSCKLKDIYSRKDTAFFCEERICILIGFLNESRSVWDFVLSYRNYRNRLWVKDYHVLEQKKSWLFPYEKIPYQSKVILYGAGQVGQDYYSQIRKTEWCQIVQWVDKQGESYRDRGLKVDDLSKIGDVDGEYIVICLSNMEAAEKVKIFLKSAGFCDTKIVIPDFNDKGTVCP